MRIVTRCHCFQLEKAPLAVDEYVEQADHDLFAENWNEELVFEMPVPQISEEINQHFQLAP